MVDVVPTQLLHVSNSRLAGCLVFGPFDMEALAAKKVEIVDKDLPQLECVV